MKKSIVLQSLKGQEKAVLSLEDKGELLVGRLRLYNFSAEPAGILSMGFKGDGEVVKAGLTRVSEMLYNFQTESGKIGQHFSCAVVNMAKGEILPILFGVSDGKPSKEEQLAEALSLYDKPISVQESEKILDENGIDFDDDIKADIQASIKETLENEKCENCKYKKCFVEEKQVSFYMKLKPQLDKMFETNPEEEYLSKIIPSSKWTKVEYAKNGDYYVLGIIYEDDKIAYLCYGVPGVYQAEPPKELSGYPVWLPLDSEKQEGFGYWLVYQNAETGESIKAVID